MTRPVKEAPSASANGKPRPVCRPDWKIRIAISAIPAPMLSSAAKLLLLRVADRAGYGRSTCWATNATLAFEAGIVIRQVQRLLSGRTDSKTDLISTGWLTSTWKTTRKGGDAHRDLALGPKTLEWIEQILPRLDTKLRARPSMDWDDHLVAPRDDHLVAPRDDHLVAQNYPSMELPHKEQSSSSSTPPPRGRKRPGDDDDDVRSASKNKSGGSKQKAKPLSDDEGLVMVRLVASQCAHLPGMAAKLQAAPELPRRCGHDWRGLARQVVRLEHLVAAGDIKFRTIENPAGYVVRMLKNKLSTAELDALDANVERLLKPRTTPPARPRNETAPTRPDHAAAIAELVKDLPGLEADVANASNRTAKQFAEANLKRTRERLAALKTAGRVAP